jgi:SecD/SecF fusion protein
MNDFGLGGLLLAQADKAGEAASSVTKTVEVAETSGADSWIILAVIVAIFVAPILLGNLLSRVLKLKDMAGRLSVVLLAFTLGIAPFAWHLYDGNRKGADWKTSLKGGVVNGEKIKGAIRLGIDLEGGTNLIFEVDHSASEKEITDLVMDQMVAAIAKRINPGGLDEIVIRRVGFDRIEIIIPGEDPADVQRTKDKIKRLGSLEFAILASRRDHGPGGKKIPRDLPAELRQEGIISLAGKLSPVEKDLRSDGRVVASWREVGLTGTEPNQTPKDVGDGGDVVTRPGRTLEDGKTVLKEFLVVFEKEDGRVTGQYLTRVSPGTDESGQLSVDFRFNGEGARRFLSLTQKYGPESDKSFHRRLAILLDGNVHSAPRINQPIGRSGQISGDFDPDEITELVAVLNAGALEVPIKPTPVLERTIGPTLAHDVQEKGVNAILLAGGAVVVFMLLYYWVAGVVAVMCLALNLVLVMGTMAAINATFTLPGLAGLVLTIGMAVDANVLIFERIREELKRGSSLRMSINNGFAKAFTTIVDANVTTLLIAVVLYMIGTDQIRGFAVTLFIGIVMSMFTSLYFGRLIFDLVERKRWLTNLKMGSLVGATSWDFISKRRFAFVVSVALIGAGMVALFARGEKNLGIDFTGGTMVTLLFDNPVDRDDVKAALEEKFDSVSLEELQVRDTTPGTRFRMQTTMRNADAFEAFDGADDNKEETVESLINAAFEGNSKLVLKKVAIENKEFNLEAIAAAVELTDDEEASKTPIAGDGDKFSGGWRIDLSFSDSIDATTAASYLEQELSKILNEEKFSRYDNPGELIALSPKEGTTLTLQATSDINEADLKEALSQMKQTMANSPLLDEMNSFAGSVASEMQQSAILAMLASLVAIVAYIWFRFQRITFGLAAVVALVHDVLIVLGMVALASFAYGKGFTWLGLEEFKINLPMIAAFLTIVGYSLNDTIVVFDRIREVRGKNPNMTVDIINTSLNQTLSRTLLTSLTTLVVVAILYAVGGEGIHGFAFCLVVGVIVGTYSSIYVASPVLLWLMNRTEGTTVTAGGRN